MTVVKPTWYMYTPSAHVASDDIDFAMIREICAADVIDKNVDLSPHVFVRNGINA